MSSYAYLTSRNKSGSHAPVMVVELLAECKVCSRAQYAGTGPADPLHSERDYDINCPPPQLYSVLYKAQNIPAKALQLLTQYIRVPCFSALFYLLERILLQLLT